jgi:hypothetical protein
MLQIVPKVKVKYIHCDNSGENHDIQIYLRERSAKMRCTFEFTVPDSPQQNGKIEKKFATLYGRVRAILNSTEFTPILRKVMWYFYSLQATRIDNILIRPEAHLAPYEMFHEETQNWIPFLRAFG